MRVMVVGVSVVAADGKARLESNDWSHWRTVDMTNCVQTVAVELYWRREATVRLRKFHWDSAM